MCFFGSVSTCINRCYITLVKPWFMHISPIFGKSLEMVHGLGFPHFNPLNPIHFPQIWWLVYNCFSQYLMVIPYFQTHPEIRLLTYTSKFSTDIPIDILIRYFQPNHCKPMISDGLYHYIILYILLLIPQYGWLWLTVDPIFPWSPHVPMRPPPPKFAVGAAEESEAESSRLAHVIVTHCIYIIIYIGGFANYLLTCLLNLQNVSHIPRVWKSLNDLMSTKKLLLSTQKTPNVHKKVPNVH